MSREIKFRAWDKKENSMTHEIEGTYDWEYVISDYDRENSRYVLMQFTGLRDKNGKEIYEGDTFDGLFESLHIGWCDQCKSLQLISNFNQDCFSCSGDITWREFVEHKDKVVIGHIYENSIMEI